MRLPKRLATVFFLWNLIFCALLYISLFILLSNFAVFLLPFLLPFILALFLLISLYIFLLFKFYRFYNSNNILYIKSGLIFRRDKRFILDRMVCMKTFSTPFMRLLKLKFLLITFEGSIYILPPVSADFAEEILDNTIERQGYEEI